MDTNRLPKQALQYKPNDEGTKDARGRCGGTNFILRIKEQETHLILQEQDDDDDDDDDDLIFLYSSQYFRNNYHQFFRCYTVQVVELLNYHTNHCT